MLVFWVLDSCRQISFLLCEEKTTVLGCDRPESYDATLVFDKAAENGKYLNGTLVKASCKTGVCIYDG